MATKHKQTVPTGNSVKFLKYGEDAEGGELRQNDILTIVGFDAKDGVYNVRCDSTGVEDSLYKDEFSTDVSPAKGKTKSKAKTEPEPAPASKSKPSNVKVEVEEEEQEEQGAEIPKFRATASVSQAVKDANGDYLAAAQTLADSEAKAKFVLGGVLAKIKRENLQAHIASDEKDAEGNWLPAYDGNLNGFNAYVRDSLNLHDRKAHSLVNIYEKFSQITTEAKIDKVGWTKLRELLPLDLTTDNVDEWLTKAKTMHGADLHESVTESLVDGEGKVHGKRGLNTQVAFKFVAFNDQAEMWKEAIAEAKKVIGEEQSDSMAVNHIFTEWLTLQQQEG